MYDYFTGKTTVKHSQCMNILKISTPDHYRIWLKHTQLQIHISTKFPLAQHQKIIHPDNRTHGNVLLCHSESFTRFLSCYVIQNHSLVFCLVMSFRIIHLFLVLLCHSESFTHFLSCYVIQNHSLGFCPVKSFRIIHLFFCVFVFSIWNLVCFPGYSLW